MSIVPPKSIPPPPEGNEYLGKYILGFTWSTVSVSTIVVILRILTRRYILRVRFWWDDYFIFAAMVANIMGAICDAFEIHFGFGRHHYYISVNSLRYFTAITYGEWIQTFFTLMCTKVSICFFLLRLQKLSISKHLIRPIQAAIVVLIVSNIVLTVMWIAQCIPAWAVWNLDTEGKCLSHQILVNVILAQAIISVVSDFTLAFYPILILWSVRLRFMEKAGLCVLMGLGVLTGSCCLVRTVLNNEALDADSTYGGITNWFWRLFEIQLGLICACIPTLIPLRKWVKTRRYGRRNESDDTLADAIAENPTKIPGPDTPSSSDPEQSTNSNITPNEVNERAIMGRMGTDFEKDLGSQSALESGGSDRYDRSVIKPGVSRPRHWQSNINAERAPEMQQYTLFPTDAVHEVSNTRKGVSFSRRDIPHRPDGDAIPNVTVTGPTPGNSLRRPERAQISAPFEVAPPPPKFGPPSPTVHVTGDPEKELDLNLAPRFDQNRSKWSRILDIDRLSWLTPSNSRSNLNSTSSK